MPWSRSRPRGRARSPLYDARHARVRQQHIDALTAAGSGVCAELACSEHSRVITPGMVLHLCHDRRTGAVLGLGHARCNVREAARYARALQTATRLGL